MRKLVLAFVLLATFGCPAPRDDARLAVMSFNIRYGTADDGANSWPNRRELVFDVIRAELPDIIGLQEALHFQLDEVSATFSGYGVLGVGRDDGEKAGEYAALLYREERFEVLDWGTFWFARTPDVPGSIDWGAHIPRICTWARFGDSETSRTFYVYNLHLDHQSQKSRERSVRLLVERIAARAHPDPVIVTGDFNADENNPAIEHLLGQSDPQLRDSFRVLHPDVTEVGTYTGFRDTTSRGKIDHVFVSDDWTVESAAIVRTSVDGRYPSDHFPVVATLVY